MIQRDQGFTVVELLVAMTVLAGVVVFLASAISFTRQYLTRSARAIDTADEIAVVNQLLRSGLNELVADTHKSPIVGSRRELLLRTNASRVPPLPGIVFLTISNQAGGAIASWHSETENTEVVRHRLTRPGSQLQFSYFTDQTGWINSWPETPPQLPKLVRVTIQHEGQSDGDLIFPIRSVRPVQCATEPGALRICGSP